MQEHQDLRLTGNVETAINAVLAAAGSGDWNRREDLEENVRRMGAGRQHCFENSKMATRPVVWLHDLRPEQEAWRVGHVGIDMGEGNVAECNEAVQSFHRWATPIMISAGGSISLSCPEQSPTYWLGEELARTLGAAIMHGYPTHPADCERWNRFLVDIHKHKLEGSMAPSQLRQWLIEDEEWDAGDAARIAIRYENGLELLRTYDQELALTEF